MAAPSSSIGNSVHFERLSDASFATSAPPLSRASSLEDSASLNSRAPLPSTLFRKVLEHLPIEDWAIIANTCDLYSSYPSQESHPLKSSSAAAGKPSLEDPSDDDFPIDESDSQFLPTRTLYENFLEIPQFSRILPKLPTRLLREKGVEEAFLALGSFIEEISTLFGVSKEILSFERKVLLAVAYNYSIFCTKVYDTLKNAGRDPAAPGLGSPQNPENPFRAFKSLSLHEIVDRENEVIEASILWLENEENKNLFKYVLRLEFKGAGLLFVPEQIRYFAHLIAADFSENWILHLPDAICELRHLASLDVSFSHMLLLPKEIGDLQELRYLFLQKQHLLGLPTSFYKLKKLEVLNLSENYMRSLFCAENWKSLKSLFLRDNQLTAFPENIEQLENLEVLDLSQNRIAEIPDSVASLSQLRALILSQNKIGEISPLLGGLEKLESLHLDNNQVRILPEELQNLVNLKEVHLHQNRIQRIATWVKYWESLETISLKENPIYRIPDVLLPLKNLQNFFVSRIPAVDAFQVSGLKRLEISNIPLRKVPGFAEKLKSISSLTLEVLSLENCNLRKFPKSILKVDSLVFLSLSKNAIREVPEEIVQLENLQNLQLAGNRLRTLPEELFSLRKLQLLDLSGNLFTRISKRIARLSSLLVLDLSRNRIVDFPRRVWFLPKLSKLHLEDNCIRSLQGSDIPFKSHEISALEFESRKMQVQLQGNPIKKIPEQIIRHSSTQLASLAKIRKAVSLQEFLKRGWAEKVISHGLPLEIVGLSREMAEVYSGMENVAGLQSLLLDAQKFAQAIKASCGAFLNKASKTEVAKFVERIRAFSQVIIQVSEEGTFLRSFLNERGAWPRLAKIRRISERLNAARRSITSASDDAFKAVSELTAAAASGT